MKRTAMFGAGSMAIAAGLAAFPAAAQSQSAAETKTLLIAEQFNGAEVEEGFVSLGACLTAATEAAGQNGFGSCEDERGGPVPEFGEEPGYLQLTDTGEYETGAVVYDEALRNRGGIEVHFAQYQYGGTGADGISFFIVDGETELDEVGAYGGSLGYAQFDDRPGVEGAYLGLGLDAWGNFSADTEGRGNGCPADQRAPEHLRDDFNRAPDNVVLRGPGSGTEGYCLLATTATDEQIGTEGTDTLWGTDFPEELNADTLEESKQLVKLKITDDPLPEVTVDIDFQDGEGWQRVLETTMPTEAPETFKFGFASSTGGANDVHLLRHLRVETFE
ncbi:lectin-like domain-containing protein [Glycomyces tenuis]|uniref:lectin-like domain-containing protein n=1 Tax=Glycomyces tenuis TaxID=58116 RepID=UPI000415D47A|nr:hypothetical protein [Glycomyces tenuis]